MQIPDNHNNAAGQIVELIADKLSRERNVHAQTIIASTARLAGSMLLRSFEFDLESQQPGDILLSQDANEKCPDLMNILSAMLAENFDVALDKSKLGGSDGTESLLTYLESAELLQTEALGIIKNNNLSFEEGAQAIAMATAFMIKESAPSIGAEVGFNEAVMGFIEGSKTIPPMLVELETAEKLFPENEFELLKRSPFLVFLLVAAADKVIDQKEMGKFQKIIYENEKFDSLLFTYVLHQAVDEADFIIQDIMSGSTDPFSELLVIAEILDTRLDVEIANEFKNVLISIAEQIAEASGGFLGFGSKISKEEKEKLNFVSLALGIDPSSKKWGETMDLKKVLNDMGMDVST